MALKCPTRHNRITIEWMSLLLNAHRTFALVEAHGMIGIHRMWM